MCDEARGNGVVGEDETRRRQRTGPRFSHTPWSVPGRHQNACAPHRRPGATAGLFGDVTLVFDDLGFCLGAARLMAFFSANPTNSSKFRWHWD